MPIPFFDMRAEIEPLRDEIDGAIRRVVDAGVFIGGAEIDAFERELAERVGAVRVVAVSSGSDALLATFMALGLTAGDEVVTTPFTFFATAGSAARLGARVVFADIDESMCLDPRAALTACTSRTRAIVPVNLFGHVAVLPTTDISIVEDSAHSLSPPRGYAATFSFFPTKNLGAFGDAGAVVTNDSTLADRVALLRSHGARPKYHHLEVGGNFRMDALQAAVLRTKLKHLAAWTDARRRHAARYGRLFADASLDVVRVPSSSPDHAYHQYVIRVPRRDALREHLRRREIGTEVYYPTPLHLVPAFADLGYREGALPRAELAAREVLALPIQPGLPNEAQDRIVDEIRQFFAQ